jgi:hypothetical protein
MSGTRWWTAWDSNPRPRRCERRALPAELAAHARWYRPYYSKRREDDASFRKLFAAAGPIPPHALGDFLSLFRVHRFPPAPARAIQRWTFAASGSLQFLKRRYYPFELILFGIQLSNCFI